MKLFRKNGFTLIELLVVIAIIAILATVVFVALDPVKRFKDARDSRRWNDVNSILTAIHEYAVDNNGSLPSGIDTTDRELGTDTSGCDSTSCSGTAASCLDLSSTLAKYLKTIPVDTLNGTSGHTRYAVIRDANNIVTVRSCGYEGSTAVQVSR